MPTSPYSHIPSQHQTHQEHILPNPSSHTNMSPRNRPCSHQRWGPNPIRPPVENQPRGELERPLVIRRLRICSNGTAGMGGHVPHLISRPARAEPGVAPHHHHPAVSVTCRYAGEMGGRCGTCCRLGCKSWWANGTKVLRPTATLIKCTYSRHLTATHIVEKPARQIAVFISALFTATLMP